MFISIKIPLLGFILFYSNVFSLNAADIQGAPHVYTACLDCNSTQIEEEIRQHYLKEYTAHLKDSESKCSSLDLSCRPFKRIIAADNWVYFTDLDNDKGLKYSGTLNSLGQISITRNYSMSQSNQDYLGNMHLLRIEAKLAKQRIQADLDAMTGTTTNQNKINQLTFESDDNGKCENNSDTSSVFDYLKDGMKIQIDSAVRAGLNTHTTETVASIDRINFSVGTGGAASLAVSVVLTESLGSFQVNFENGYLIFNIDRVGNGFNSSFNLNQSQLSSGAIRNGGEITNIPLSSIFREDGQGSFQPNNNLDITFNDPCLTDDFKDVISALGGNSFAFPPDYENSAGCHDIHDAAFLNEIRWTTYSTRFVVGNGVVTLTLVIEHHSMDIPADGDRSAFNQICGGG